MNKITYKGATSFYAFRIDGMFKCIRAQAISHQQEGARLVDAAKAQSEFHFSNVIGTLVGLWSPGFSSAFSISGYYFHFFPMTDRRVDTFWTAKADH